MNFKGEIVFSESLFKEIMRYEMFMMYDVRFLEVGDIDILKYYLKINSESKELVDADSFAIYTLRHKSVIFTI